MAAEEKHGNQMTKVNSNTEWGTLKEVILGRAEYAQVPSIKRHDIHCVDYANYDSVNGSARADTIQNRSLRKL
jgi:hypothetical protein